MISELDYERDKAERLTSIRPASTLHPAAALSALREYEAGARHRGVDFISLRRVRDVLGLSVEQMEHLRALLRDEGGSQYRPPVWVVAR